MAVARQRRSYPERNKAHRQKQQGRWFRSRDNLNLAEKLIAGAGCSYIHEHLAG
jgi:hypothetical protein